MDSFALICQFVGFIVVGCFLMYVVMTAIQEAYYILYGVCKSFKGNIKEIHIGDSATKILLTSLYNKGYRYVRLVYHEDGRNSLQVAIAENLGYCEEVLIDDYVAVQLYAACVADTISYPIEDVLVRL